MGIESTLERIRTCGVVAVIRGVHAQVLDSVVEAVLAGGVDCVEVAMSVRGALRDISVLKERWGDRVVIGAGEVLNAEMAVLAHGARADFCAGVGANEEMIRVCNQRDILAVPGALTPTEIQAAWHAGASLIKLFPAELVGPSYLEAVHRPLPRADLMPSGGINPHNAAHYVRAGAVAVGAGVSVVAPALVDAGDFGAITRNAAAMLKAIADARASLA